MVADNKFTSASARPVVCQLLAMLVCTCLAVFGGLAIIAQADDQGDLRNSQALLQTAIEVSKAELARNARDYANWGDLYENSQHPPDLQWLAGNIGLSVSQNLAIDAQYLLMPDDSLAFAFVNGELMAPGSSVDLDRGLEQLVDQARQSRKMPSQAVSGLLRASGQIALTAAAAVRPGVGTSAPADGRPAVILFVRYLTPQMLDGIGQNYLIDDLALAAGTAPTDSVVPLTAVDGTVLGLLTWRQERDGWQIVSAAMPLLVAALLIATGCCFLILRRAYRKGIALLQHHALHDMLTGMPNRVFVQRELERALSRSQPGRVTVLLCLDLDRFKEVNDSWGHDAGDELLRQAAGRLLRAVRGSDIVGRTGGDEFAVLLGRIDDLVEVEAICRRLLAAMASAFDVHGHIVHIGLSIGGAIAPADGTTPTQLLKNADIALYRAKAEGRGTFCFFAPEMDERLQARKQLEHELRCAIEQDAIDVQFQPQVDIETGRVTGVEALARWDHPLRGPISPSEFIPLAEQSGLIDAIGRTVLFTACRHVARWPDITVAVNLSAVQFRRPGLGAMVEEALASARLPPQRLELEITESTLLDDADGALDVIMRLKKLGVRIAMDDFGTGYSSLYNLQRYPFDRIKIDRSFIARVTQDAGSEAIVKAVIALGQGLGLAVTAEGVEAPEQVALLAREGCKSAQGFIYSRAIDGRELDALIHTRLGPARPRLVGRHVGA